MSISNTIGLGNKLDSAYYLMKTIPVNTSLKLDSNNEPLIEDNISISPEARGLADEGIKKYIGVNDYSQEELDVMAGQIRESSDDSNSTLKIQMQCFVIAMRIISGDNVPNKDRAFLAEHEPEMLGRALLLARTKEKPKDYKSILEDEKVDGTDNSAVKDSLTKAENITEESISTEIPEISIDLEI